MNVHKIEGMRFPITIERNGECVQYTQLAAEELYRKLGFALGADNERLRCEISNLQRANIGWQKQFNDSVDLLNDQGKQIASLDSQVKELEGLLEIAARNFITSNGAKPDWWIDYLRSLPTQTLQQMRKAKQ